MKLRGGHLLADCGVADRHRGAGDPLGQLLPAEKQAVSDLFRQYPGLLYSLLDDTYPIGPTPPALSADVYQIVDAVVASEFEREGMREALKPLLAEDQRPPRALAVQWVADRSNCLVCRS